MKSALVRLWKLDLDSPELTAVVEARSCLDAAERRRADAFRFAIHRSRFAAARIALRIILGRTLGISPGAVRFGYEPNGKPFLLQDARASDWQFNVAHSGGHALIALVRGHRVGTDIELVDKPYAELHDVATIFSRDEQDALKALPPEDATVAFYRCWARKEAFVKALGIGITVDLTMFSVGLGERAELLRVDPSLADRNEWRLATLDALAPGEPGYAAALAIEGAMPDIEWQRSPLPS